jgi:SHAQKYF class myb-like DNA-binding protein
MLSKRIPSRDGRWTQEEHELFLKGMTIHGRSWTKVAEIVKTRTTVQVRSHAQKFEMKAAKRAQRALNAQARARGKRDGNDISGFVPRSAEVASCAFDLSDYEYQDPHDVSAECGTFEVTPLAQMGTADASTTTHDLHTMSHWSADGDVQMNHNETPAGGAMWYHDEVTSTMGGGGTAGLHDIDISAADAMLIEDALMLEEPETQPMGNMWETEYDGFLNMNPAEADLGHISHSISSDAHDISGADSMFSQF